MPAGPEALRRATGSATDGRRGRRRRAGRRARDVVARGASRASSTSSGVPSASLPGQLDAVARSVARTVQTARAVSCPQPGGGRRRCRRRPFQAPQTSINGAISPHRRVAFADLSLTDVRRVAAVFGGTTNDVVLAVTAGGLRAFFAGTGRGARDVAGGPGAGVGADRGRTGGPRATGCRRMLVSLATGVADPAARLRHIRDGMRAAKEQNRAVGPDVFAVVGRGGVPGRRHPAVPAGDQPPALRPRGARRSTWWCPTCPGPDVPVYLAGARMVSLHPLGPIMEGVGVNVTVFSYLDTVHVGIQACWDLVPDVDVLAGAMEASLAELVAEADRRDRPVPWWHAEAPGLTDGPRPLGPSPPTAPRPSRSSIRPGPRVIQMDGRRRTGGAGPRSRGTRPGCSSGPP